VSYSPYSALPLGEFDILFRRMHSPDRNKPKTSYCRVTLSGIWLGKTRSTGVFVAFPLPFLLLSFPSTPIPTPGPAPTLLT
jgi:hypothetical protein